MAMDDWHRKKGLPLEECSKAHQYERVNKMASVLIRARRQEAIVTAMRYTTEPCRIPHCDRRYVALPVNRTQ